MIECSSCGAVLGHLYLDHLELTERLTKDLARNGSPTDVYVSSTGVDLKPNLDVYYAWARARAAEANSKAMAALEEDEVFGEIVDKTPKITAANYLYTPQNMIARALLSPVRWTEQDFPYSLAPDGQRSMFAAATCCLRMFMADPSAY